MSNLARNMKIRHIRVLLFFLIKVLVSANNTNHLDESAEVNVDEDYETIKRYRTLKQNRPVKFQREHHHRIVGGVNSSVDKHPYVVSIKQVEDWHICGGSIIHRSWVLTASHCITEDLCRGKLACKVQKRDVLRDPRELEVYAGTSDLQPLSTGGQIREIFQLVKHPSFSRPLLHNDIGLIKVKNPFIFNKKVQIIRIPQVSFLRGKDVYQKYKECKAIGWGARLPRSGKPENELSEQEKKEIELDQVAPNLMEVNLPVIPLEWCQSLINHLYITTRHMCTMYVPGGKDACEGDSGGPLVCKQNNVILQYGITSWGHGCARPQTPAVFTKTDTYYDWVQRIISGGPNVDYYNSSNKLVCTKWLLYLIYIICNNNIVYHFVDLYSSYEPVSFLISRTYNKIK